MGRARQHYEFVFDPVVQAMEEGEQRRLLLLLHMDARGDLDRFDEREIACALRLSPEELRKSKAIFIKKGLIDEDWHIQLRRERQSRKARGPAAASPSSSTERVRRFRQKHVNDGSIAAHVTPDETQCNASCNAHETLDVTPDETQTVPVCSSSVINTQNTTTTNSRNETQGNAHETLSVILYGNKVTLDEAGLNESDLPGIIEWEIQHQIKNGNTIRNFGAFRKALSIKAASGQLDVTEYMAATKTTHPVVQSASSPSKCLECGHCEGRACYLNYEGTRQVAPLKLEGCDFFTLREDVGDEPATVEDIRNLTRSLFSAEKDPVSPQPKPVQVSMDRKISFELRAELERKQNEARLKHARKDLVEAS